ncbi:FAD-binding oxidoreductase [bacterium]|nr:FAD-binding oxidoreductase [bacterium]
MTGAARGVLLPAFDLIPDDGEDALRTKLEPLTLNVSQMLEPANKPADDKATKPIVGSITAEAGSLSAYKLTIGILKLALKKGLNLQCNTPARELVKVPISERQRGNWVVETARGNVWAKNLIMATNGYTGHLYPPLRGLIIPRRGHVTAQRPGKSMPKTGLPATYSFVGKSDGEYLVSQPHNGGKTWDLVIGGGSASASDWGLGERGNVSDNTSNKEIINHLNRAAASRFGSNWGPDDPKTRIRAAWTGIMGFSTDNLPFIGPVPKEPGLFISASFQGHGMVFCWLCAKVLTETRLLHQTGKPLLSDPKFPSSFWVTEERLKPPRARGKPFHPTNAISDEPKQKEGHVHTGISSGTEPQGPAKKSVASSSSERNNPKPGKSDRKPRKKR